MKCSVDDIKQRIHYLSIIISETKETHDRMVNERDWLRKELFCAQQEIYVGQEVMYEGNQVKIYDVKLCPTGDHTFMYLTKIGDMSFAGPPKLMKYVPVEIKE